MALADFDVSSGYARRRAHRLASDRKEVPNAQSPCLTGAGLIRRSHVEFPAKVASTRDRVALSIRTQSIGDRRQDQSQINGAPSTEVG